MSKMLEKVMEKKTAKDIIDTMREKEIKNIRNYKVIVGLQELAILLDEAKMLSNEIATFIDELDEKFPEYGFKNHKGYPTKAHLEAIKKYGLLDNYRFTFGPVRDLILNGEKSERKIRKTNF